MMTKDKNGKETNGFLDKLYLLFNEDGMMRNMYLLFQEYIDTFSPAELFLLSIIQDEYQKLYDQYYIQKNETETDGLDRILSDKYVIEMEKSEQTNPLIISYIQFIKADRCFFTRDYNGAIRDYEEAFSRILDNHIGVELSSVDKERCAYLLNSIAWSYKLKDPQSGNNEAIMIYQKLFLEFEDVDQYFFAWRYRRNYGVCLENEDRYLEALEQYKKALDMPDTINEYKLYLTYCSAVMKYWDRETGKLTGEWITNVKEMYKKKGLLSAESFREINTMLDRANKNMRSKDLSSMLPDYYNQMTKMLTYKMMVAERKTDRERYVDEIKKNLKILEAVSANAIGRHYIARDFYYALSELPIDANNKSDCFMMAWTENETLNGRGDSRAFREMLMDRRQIIEYKNAQRQ